MPEKAALLSTKAWYKVNSKTWFLRSFLYLQWQTLVISLRKEKRVVALPREKGAKPVVLKFLTMHRIQLTRSVDETSFVVSYVKVCGK